MGDRCLGTPYLVGAQANLTCDVNDTHSYGTHTIVIGKVDAITASYDITRCFIRTASIRSHLRMGPIGSFQSSSVNNS